jgi:hypothetical protein
MRACAAVRALRDLFAELAFVEVRDLALQVSPGNEIHPRLFGVELAMRIGATAAICEPARSRLQEALTPPASGALSNCAGLP